MVKDLQKIRVREFRSKSIRHIPNIEKLHLLFSRNQRSIRLLLSMFFLTIGSTHAQLSSDSLQPATHLGTKQHMGFFELNVGPDVRRASGTYQAEGNPAPYKA